MAPALQRIARGVDQYSGTIFHLAKEDLNCSVHPVLCSDISQLPSGLIQLTLLVEEDELNYNSNGKLHVLRAGPRSYAAQGVSASGARQQFEWNWSQTRARMYYELSPGEAQHYHQKRKGERWMLKECGTSERGGHHSKREDGRTLQPRETKERGACRNLYPILASTSAPRIRVTVGTGGSLGARQITAIHAGQDLGAARRAGNSKENGTQEFEGECGEAKHLEAPIARYGKTGIGMTGAQGTREGGDLDERSLQPRGIEG
ncbi:hypothetical protein B0H13DRAFT_1903346 [Mycena leptocephala]|nr:hypothetical protein B0H13DRAFT_1903346 [Mycena leptocephala]